MYQSTDEAQKNQAEGEVKKVVENTKFTRPQFDYFGNRNEMEHFPDPSFFNSIDLGQHYKVSTAINGMFQSAVENGFS